MIRSVVGGILKLLVGFLGLVLSIPAFVFINVPTYLMQVVVKLECWSRGQHQFDPYQYLFGIPSNASILCSVCRAPMPEKDIPNFLAARDALINNIKTVSEHLKVVSEKAEVEQELTKLE